MQRRAYTTLKTPGQRCLEWGNGGGAELSAAQLNKAAFTRGRVGFSWSHRTVWGMPGEGLSQFCTVLCAVAVQGRWLSGSSQHRLPLAAPSVQAGEFSHSSYSGCNISAPRASFALYLPLLLCSHCPGSPCCKERQYTTCSPLVFNQKGQFAWVAEPPYRVALFLGSRAAASSRALG